MALSSRDPRWVLEVGVNGSSSASCGCEQHRRWQQVQPLGRTVACRSKEFSVTTEACLDDSDQYPALVWRPCSPLPSRCGQRPPCSVLCPTAANACHFPRACVSTYHSDWLFGCSTFWSICILALYYIG
uniref:Uncharacterized protein n=1 Tax=Myotis myotis TaxID=51298 RepID=A0A7J7Z4Q2_MYOMY|nr:hypothetical protein mMyoMyo1_010579 [Myotis myotis]